MTHIEVLAEIADTSEGMRIRQEDIDILTKRLATLCNEQKQIGFGFRTICCRH